MKLAILLVLATALSPAALAQTRGPFKPGQTLYTNSFSAPPGFVGLNDVFGTKVDTTNGVLTNPTINGSVLTGPVAQIGTAAGTARDAAAAIAAETAAQTTANAALPKAGGTMAGSLAVGANALTGSDAVFTGGSIDAMTIGGTSPRAGTFTNVTANNAASFNSTLQIGNDTGAGNGILDGTAGGNKILQFNSASVARWKLVVSGANTGSNAGDNFLLNAESDTGTSIGTALTLTRATLEATFGGQVNVEPGALALTSSSVAGQNFFIPSVTGTDSSAYTYISNRVASDSSTAPGSTLMSNSYTYGGTSYTGGNTTLANESTQTSATNDTSGGFYLNELVQSLNSFNAGGTSTSAAAGSVYGINTINKLASGSTFYNELTGVTVDTEVDSGASVNNREGLNVNLSGSSGVQGSMTDTQIEIGANQNVTMGAKYGIELGDTNNEFPVQGTILGIGYSHVRSALTINPQNGVDFTEADFSGNAWMSPGAKITPSGSYQTGPGALSWSSSGVALGATGEVATATAIVAGGAGWTQGQVVTTGNGDIYTANVTSGAITSLTTAVAATSQGTPPSNPLTVFGDFGNAATVNLTWAAATTLSLNSAGGVVKFGSGAFTANGTTAATLTSLAPSGAHATVQEWFTITDASGTVRYIPAF
jgi:hypothetical protein